jgi:hypothetical protein
LQRVPLWRVKFILAAFSILATNAADFTVIPFETVTPRLIFTVFSPLETPTLGRNQLSIGDSPREFLFHFLCGNECARFAA